MLYILERNTLLKELNIISLMVNMHGVVVTGTLASQIGRPGLKLWSDSKIVISLGGGN